MWLTSIYNKSSKEFYLPLEHIFMVWIRPEEWPRSATCIVSIQWKQQFVKPAHFFFSVEHASTSGSCLSATPDLIFTFPPFLWWCLLVIKCMDVLTRSRLDFGIWIELFIIASNLQIIHTAMVRHVHAKLKFDLMCIIMAPTIQNGCMFLYVFDLYQIIFVITTCNHKIFS